MSPGRHFRGPAWIQHTAIFGQSEEPKARELFQSVARKEKNYPSGFNPCSGTNGQKIARGQGEAFNARKVRKLVKDDIPLSDYLDRCLVEIPKLLAFVDQAEGDQEEKVRIKQALLRFQARERLTEVRK